MSEPWKDQKWRLFISQPMAKDKERHRSASVATIEDILRWFPEINERFFLNFNVDKFEFTFEYEGNLSTWLFVRIVDGC
jgi:hypothetical protein